MGGGPQQGLRKAFPDVNVAAVIRGAISRKVKELKKLEELKKKGVI